MFEKHPAFITPPEDAIIWRYMDFSKFLSILENKSLYFTRSDRFDDQFEGSLPYLSSEALRSYNASELPNTLEVNKKFYKPDRIYNMRKTIGLNCWHLNSYESAAMWKLYLKSNEGFAIQSTFARLRDSFKNNKERIFIGQVNYIDYKRHKIPLMDTFSPFLTKRISFKYEQELRALIWDYQTINSDSIEPIDESRLDVSINIESLIERVYLSPDSPKWLEKLVNKILSNYSLSVPVLKSQLSEEPLF